MRNEEGKGVFIAERLHQLSKKVTDVHQTLAYVRYYYTVIQRLSRTFKYYPAGILKSSEHPCTFERTSMYYLQSTVYNLSVYVWWSPTIRPHYKQQCTFGIFAYVHIKIGAYIRLTYHSSIQRSKKCPFCVLSDLKPKLIP